MRPEVGLGVEVRAHPQHQREDEEGEGRVACAGRPCATCLPTIGESTIASRPTGAITMPASRRRVAHVLLQPQRQQHHVAEEQAIGDRQSRACPSRSCAARTGAGRPPGARRSAPRRGRTRSRPTATTASATIWPRRTSRSSLPMSSMICSAPTHSTSRREARPCRSAPGACRSRACGRSPA